MKTPDSPQTALEHLGPAVSGPHGHDSPSHATSFVARPAHRSVWRLERKSPPIARVVPHPPPAPPPRPVALSHQELDITESLGEVRTVKGDLPPDQAAWLPVAQRILDGEFDGAARSTAESLTIGLRSIQHPLCREALAQLAEIRPK